MARGGVCEQFRGGCGHTGCILWLERPMIRYLCTFVNEGGLVSASRRGRDSLSSTICRSFFSLFPFFSLFFFCFAIFKPGSDGVGLQRANGIPSSGCRSVAGFVALVISCRSIGIAGCGGPSHQAYHCVSLVSVSGRQTRTRSETGKRGFVRIC